MVSQESVEGDAGSRRTTGLATGTAERNALSIVRARLRDAGRGVCAVRASGGS